MAQRPREKELNTNNSNNASGDFFYDEVDVSDGGEFQYDGGHFYAPGGYHVQQSVPPDSCHYQDRRRYGRTDDRRRQESSLRGTSRSNRRQNNSSGRRTPDRRLSTARDERFVQVLCYVTS